MWKRRWKTFRSKLETMLKEKWELIYNRVLKNLRHKIKRCCSRLKTIWKVKCSPVYALVKKKLNYKFRPHLSELRKFIIHFHKAFVLVIVLALLRWFFVRIFIKFFNIETALTQKGVIVVIIVLILYGSMLAIIRLFWPNNKKAKVITDITYNIVLSILLVALTTSILAVMFCGLFVDIHMNLGLFKISKKFWTDSEIRTFCEHIFKYTKIFGYETTKKYADVSKIVSESKNSLHACSFLLLEEMKRLIIIDDAALPTRFKLIREFVMEDIKRIRIDQGKPGLPKHELTAIANPLAWEYYEKMEQEELAYKNSKEYQGYLAVVASLKDMGIKVLLVGGVLTVIVLIFDVLTK